MSEPDETLEPTGQEIPLFDPQVVRERLRMRNERSIRRLLTTKEPATYWPPSHPDRPASAPRPTEAEGGEAL